MSQFEPDPRRYPYSVLIDGELYVYGGKDEVTDLLQIFDSCLEVWKEVPTHGSPPPGLAAGASAHSGHYFYVYGGVKEDYSLSGCLHRLDSMTSSWTRLAAYSANAPMKKFGCGMVVYENSVVVIGGRGIKAGPIQPGSEWIRGGNAQGITNEMHKYELSEGKKV